MAIISKEEESKRSGIKVAAEVSDEDEALEVVGEFGAYQKLYVVLVQVATFLWCSNYYFMSLAGLPLRMRCNTTGEIGDSIPSICALQSNCTGHMEPMHDEFWSIQMEWPQETVLSQCSKATKVDIRYFITSAQMLAMGASAFLSGFLSDIIGRRYLALAGCMGLVGTGALASFSNCWQMLAPLIASGGAFFGMAMSPLITLGTEHTGSKYRLIVNLGTHACLAYPYIALIAWATRNWRQYILVTSMLGLPSVVMLLFYGESPRWLLDQGLYKRAAMVLNKIAKFNRQEAFFTPEILRGMCNSVRIPPQKGTSATFEILKSCFRLFTSKSLGKVATSVAIVNAVIYVLCTSVQFNLGDFITSPFLSIAMFGLFQLWTPFVSVYMDLKYRWFTRKGFYYWSAATVTLPFTGGLIAIMVSEFSNGYNRAAELTTAILMITAAAMNFGFLYYAIGQITVEIMPTKIRNAALGMLNVAQMIGAAVATQMLQLQEVWRPLPYILTEVLLIAGLLFGAWVLPETKGEPLPNDISETKTLIRKSSSKCLNVMEAKATEENLLTVI